MDRYNPLIWEPTQKPEPGFDEINWDHPLSRGLVGYIPLNEGAGSAAMDIVKGRSISAGTTKPTWSNGGANFNGSSFFDGAGCASALSSSNNFSIVFWASATALQVNGGAISIRAGAASNCIIYPFDSGNGATGLRYWQSGNVFQDTATSGRADGLPHHFCITSAGSAGKAAYVDGSQILTSVNTNSLASGMTSVGVGSWPPGPQNFTGTVYHASFYNRALTAAEVADLYRNPFAMFAPTSSRSHGQLVSVSSPFESAIFDSPIIGGAA